MWHTRKRAGDVDPSASTDDDSNSPASSGAAAQGAVERVDIQDGAMVRVLFELLHPERARHGLPMEATLRDLRDIFVAHFKPPAVPDGTQDPTLQWLSESVPRYTIEQPSAATGLDAVYLLYPSFDAVREDLVCKNRKFWASKNLISELIEALYRAVEQHGSNRIECKITCEMNEHQFWADAFRHLQLSPRLLGTYSSGVMVTYHFLLEAPWLAVPVRYYAFPSPAFQALSSAILPKEATLPPDPSATT